MELDLIVTAFPQGGQIPRLHTCDGADLSPPMEWSGEPLGTKGFALIVDDPDAPRGTWNHWLLYDIPANIHSLAQGFKPGQLGHDGINDFGKQGYGGPCPPKGHEPHRYFFRLYAVDTDSLGIPGGGRRADLDSALQGHTLARSEYLGRYQR